MNAASSQWCRMFSPVRKPILLLVVAFVAVAFSRGAGTAQATRAAAPVWRRSLVPAHRVQLVADRRCGVNRGLIGTMIGVLVVIVLLIVILQLT